MTPPHTSSFITGFRHDNSYKATLSPSTIAQQPQKPDGCQNDDGQNQPMIANNQPNKNSKNANCNMHNARSFTPYWERTYSFLTLFSPRQRCAARATNKRQFKNWLVPGHGSPRCTPMRLLGVHPRAFQVYTYGPLRCTHESLSGVHLWGS